jgi:hypothetical protein
MKSTLKAATWAGPLILTLSSAAFAQLGPEPPAPATAADAVAPLYDPQQLPSHRGQVLQFTLTPRGEIDGLILTDGTEVKTPPHLSTQIAYSVKPGDTVTIHGLQAAALPLIQAVSITDEANRRTVIDSGPEGPGRGPGGRRPAPDEGPGPRASLQSELHGRVRLSLHGPRGEVNGALLDDGTVLRVPPVEADWLVDLLRPGRSLFAQGALVSTAIGKVFEVQQIGPSRDQLTPVDVPPGFLSGSPPKPPRGPRGGPDAPPPPPPRS